MVCLRVCVFIDAEAVVVVEYNFIQSNYSFSLHIYPPGLYPMVMHISFFMVFVPFSH